MKQDNIIQMLRSLEASNIFCTKEFKDDIISLVDTDINKFISVFTIDMQKTNIDEYNKFEKLNLTPIQKRKLDNNNLYRYEYRRSNKNLKCMFIVEREDKSKLLLSAFQEDGDKTKGKNSYSFNIAKAINNYTNSERRTEK